MEAEVTTGHGCPVGDRISPRGDQACGAGARPSVVGPRLYLAFVVLVGAEIFSGASAGPKLFGWWTWCVTFWLYFLHFFLFANLALRTRRTSLRALYLWGVLYGLYEGPLTKVIWAGFGADGELALARDGFTGQLLGHGLTEMSMALLWHPFVSFLLPLYIATLLMPELRELFPDIGRLFAGSRPARLLRTYAAATFALTLPAVMSFAYGGARTPTYVLLTWAVVLGLLMLGYRCFAQRMRQPGMAYRVVVLQRRAYALTWFFFVLMYVLFYFGLRPEALPPAKVQLLTCGLYLLTGLAIWRTPAIEPVSEGAVADTIPSEWRRLRWGFATVVVGSVVLGLLAVVPSWLLAMQTVFAANALVWTLLGPAAFLSAAFPRR
jgi:hypothetical protein